MPLSWGRWPSHSLSSRCLGGSWILFNQRNGLFAQISDLSANSTTSCDICNYNVLDSKGDPIPGVYGFNSVYNTYKNDVGGGFTRTMPKASRNSFWKGSAGARRTTLDSRN